MSGGGRPERDLLAEFRARQQQAAPDPLATFRASKAGAPSGDFNLATPILDEPGAVSVAAPGPKHDYHAEFRSGALAKRMAGANAREAANLREEEAAQPGYFERFATHLLNTAQGIPGLRAIEAGFASGPRENKMGVQSPGLTFAQARDALDEQTGKIGGKTAFAERLLGGLATAPILPGGIVRAGATYGGLDAALSADDESLDERALHTGVGTGAGAVTGLALKGGGAVAQRLGVTDLVSRGLRRVGQAFRGPVARAAGDVGEATGTKGALNEVLADRQAILDKLPASDKPAAQAVADHADKFYREAQRLYGVAQQDKALIADPRVRQAVNDPIIQQAFQVVQDRLNLPMTTVSANPATPAGAAAIAGHAGAGTPPMIQVVSTMPSLPPGRAGMSLTPPPQTRAFVDLPTPELLAQTKRLADAIVSGKFQAGGIGPSEAAQLAPKVDLIRSALHDASPAWKEADAHYANGKAFEDAFNKAYGAGAGPAGQAAPPRKLKTQEAITRWAARGKGDIGVNRVAGQQAGTQQRLAESLRAAPIGSTIGETVDAANGLFKPSEAAARYARPAFNTDADRLEFARLLASGRGTGGDFDIRLRTPIGKVGVGLPDWMTASPLETSAGQAARAEAATRLASPTEAPRVQRDIEAAKRGRKIIRVGSSATGVTATRAASGVVDDVRGRHLP